MLITRARVATSFVYDFHFYHYVDRPYIQTLRSRFIGQLERAQPRFVIQVTTEDKPWPSGANTTRAFPELERILATAYAVVSRGEGYSIYELRRPAAPMPPPGAAGG